jgi:hypothetical protein
MMTGLTTRPSPDDDVHRELTGFSLSPDRVLRLRVAARRGARASGGRASARRLRARPAGPLHARLRGLPLGRRRSRIDRCRVAVSVDHIGMAFHAVLAAVGGGMALGGDHCPLRQAARPGDATYGLCHPNTDMGVSDVAGDSGGDVAAPPTLDSRRSRSSMEVDAGLAAWCGR